MHLTQSSELRKYLRKENELLANRADNFWEISKPIIERQNSPNSNENGYHHVMMVERNCWRLLNESNNLSEFSPEELFILSCSACCHDFDKGLLSDSIKQKDHGEGSGAYLLENYKQLQQKFPEVIAIRNIIGIHDLTDDEFRSELQNISNEFSISTGPIKLKKLAVILKTSDVLHTDNSRISDIGIDFNSLEGIDRKKYLARQSILGWRIDGTRIIVSAMPQSLGASEALEGCIKYIEKKEWTSVTEKLCDYNFPHVLEFQIDKKLCMQSSECTESIKGKKSIVIDKDGSDIPPVVLNWVGREKELETLHGNFKVFYITGIGGQGKSATAATVINNDNIKEKFGYIDWRDFKEEDHKFQNKIMSMIKLVSSNHMNFGDLVGLSDDNLISIFFKELGDKIGLFVLDNVDSYIDLEKFMPTKGIGKLFSAAINKNHNSKFIFTCRPFIRYANVNFYQLALDGLTLKNTIQFFKNSDISVKADHIESIAQKAHELTKGHPLWISLIVAQAKRGEKILTDFLTNLELNQTVDKDVSSLLSETILKEIWDTLNPKQRTLLRILAESVRAETEEDFSQIASVELNHNAFSKSLTTLKNFNLIVEKLEGDFIELHPLVKEFVRSKYPQNDRSKFIALFIRYYDRIVLVLKPRLSPQLSISEFSNWINKIELHTNAKQFQKAFDCISEILSPMLAAGYNEELLRVSKLLFNSLTWRKEKVDEFNRFKNILSSISKAAVEYGDKDFADSLIERFGSVTETKEDNYILFCSLKGYMYWFTEDNEKAIKILREAEYLITAGKQEDKHQVRHHLALSLRDSREKKSIEEAIDIFLQQENLKTISDNVTIDDDLGGSFYGNIGRCLQFQSEFELSLNCYLKSFTLISIDDGSNRLINLGYASKWIAEILFEQGRTETGFYFLKYAIDLWKKCSPPLANQCKIELMAKESNSTVKSILSLDFWQIEKYCNDFLKKNTRAYYRDPN